MSNVAQAKRNARCEIALNVNKLMAKPAPENEIDRAARLDHWEQIGAAILEYLKAEEAEDAEERQRFAVLEELASPESFLR